MNRQEERAALLVIDLERGFIDESSPLCIRDAAATLPACGQAITYAREEGVPVFFIHRAYRADGSDVEACRYSGWQAGGKPLTPGSTGSGSRAYRSRIRRADTDALRNDGTVRTRALKAELSLAPWDRNSVMVP